MQLGCLGTGEKAEGKEGRTEPGGEVQEPARARDQASSLAVAGVCEAELPARVGKRDLAVVEMPGADQVEGLGRHPPRDTGEVAETDAKRRLGIG